MRFFNPSPCRLWWIAAALWLLLILGGYRYDLFPPSASAPGAANEAPTTVTAAPRPRPAPSPCRLPSAAGRGARMRWSVRIDGVMLASGSDRGGRAPPGLGSKRFPTFSRSTL